MKAQQPIAQGSLRSALGLFLVQPYGKPVAGQVGELDCEQGRHDPRNTVVTAWMCEHYMVTVMALAPFRRVDGRGHSVWLVHATAEDIARLRERRNGGVSRSALELPLHS